MEIPRDVWYEVCLFSDFSTLMRLHWVLRMDPSFDRWLLHSIDQAPIFDYMTGRCPTEYWYTLSPLRERLTFPTIFVAEVDDLDEFILFRHSSMFRLCETLRCCPNTISSPLASIPWLQNTVTGLTYVQYERDEHSYPSVRTLISHFTHPVEHVWPNVEEFWWKCWYLGTTVSLAHLPRLKRLKVDCAGQQFSDWETVAPQLESLQWLNDCPPPLPLPRLETLEIQFLTETWVDFLTDHPTLHTCFLHFNRHLRWRSNTLRTLKVASYQNPILDMAQWSALFPQATQFVIHWAPTKELIGLYSGGTWTYEVKTAEVEFVPPPIGVRLRLTVDKCLVDWLSQLSNNRCVRIDSTTIDIS